MRSGVSNAAIPPRRSSGSSVARTSILVAMATHGHRLLGDLVHGTTVNRVRHELEVPVLLLRAK